MEVRAEMDLAPDTVKRESGPSALIEQVRDVYQWRKVLEYYIACLNIENRLHYVIKPEDIAKACYSLLGMGGQFLSEDEETLTLTSRHANAVEALRRFVLGDPSKTIRPPVSFGYPFFVSTQGQLMPLLYVDVKGMETPGGVMLVKSSPEVEVNFAALWELMPGDREVGLENLFTRYEALEIQPGESLFDRQLAFLLSEIEEFSGFPVQHISQCEFDLENMPKNAVVECPVLFRVHPGFTSQLLRELNQLLKWHSWDDVLPALRECLAGSQHIPYPQVSDLAVDPRLYVVPANDSQRQAVAATSQRLLTVVTGPPGTGKSQLILNIVGDAVLRGETVLIASRNNQAVEVISERFLDKVRYPGAVRTGSYNYRKTMPALMEQAFATVQQGRLTNRMAEIRAQYDRVLKSLESQQQLIVQIEQLMYDRRVYQSELRDLISLLPSPLDQTIGRVQIYLSEEEGVKLSAPLRTLLTDAEAIVDRQRNLAQETQEVLTENRDDLALLRQMGVEEERPGPFASVLRKHANLNSLEAISVYLEMWNSLVEALRLCSQLEGLSSDVLKTQHQAEMDREELPDEWAADLKVSAAHFDMAAEQEMRRSLQSLQSEIQRLLNEHRILIERLTELIQWSAFTHAVADLMGWHKAGTGHLERVDLVFVRDALCLLNRTWYVYRESAQYANLSRRLQLLQADQDHKLTEFTEKLADMDERIIAMRAQIPALAIMQASSAAEKGDYKAWRDLARQFYRLDEWCQRVRKGKLRVSERLQQVVSPKWAIDRVIQEVKGISSSFGRLATLNPLDLPSQDASFEEWTDYVQGWLAFASVCAHTNHRKSIEEQHNAYRSQSDRELAELRELFSRTENALREQTVNLPRSVTEKLLSSSWSFSEQESFITSALAVVQAQYGAVAAGYTKAVRYLQDLQGRYMPMLTRLKGLIDALVLPGAIDAAGHDSFLRTGILIEPASINALVLTWSHFSKATEAEHRLLVAQRKIADVQQDFDVICDRLPEETRNNLRSAHIEYADAAVQPLGSRLADLRGRLTQIQDSWEELQRRADQLLRQNCLQSTALAQALERAPKEPSYLADLMDDKAYHCLEELIRELRTWEGILRVWRAMTQLAVTNDKLKQVPPLELARTDIDRLYQERQSLAGQVLAERWKETGNELSTDQIRSIGHYLDAIQALAGDPGSSFRLLKQQTESHFADALRLFPVWSTTNLSTQDIPLRPGLFDCVIIDEASQCDIPSALPLLFRAKRIVIIGDANQLKHIASLPRPVHDQLVAEHTIGASYSYRDQSLFDLAADSVAGVPGVILLNEHYRSHEEIIGFSNQAFYGCRLQVHTDLSNVPAQYRAQACGIYWLDIKGRAERPGPGRIFNRDEERVVVELLPRLAGLLGSLNMPDRNIGVVTPFRAQADNLKRSVNRLRFSDERIRVGTVHTYQGDERDVMLFSTVATGHLPEKTFQFMDDRNLLNVAVTRARLTLIVIGDHAFFMGQHNRSPYHSLATYVQERNRVFAGIDELPLFQPVSDEDQGFDLGRGVALDKHSPYSNRLTLRRLLASCREYLWWYDPYMNIDALDALVLAQHGWGDSMREVRLLTSERFWENQKEEPLCITKKAIRPLQRELESRGIKLQLGISAYDRDSPPPHDRYLFSAGLAVNMPPIKNIYQDAARLAEFLPSTVRPAEFEEWWQKARIVVS